MEPDYRGCQVGCHEEPNKTELYLTTTNDRGKERREGEEGGRGREGEGTV